MSGWLRETHDKSTNLSGDILAAAGDFNGTPPAGLSGTTGGHWQYLPSWDKISLSLICSAAASFLVCVSNMNPQSEPNDDPVPPPDSYDGAPWFVENFNCPNASQNSSTGVITFTAAGECLIPIKIEVQWIKVKVLSNLGRVSAPIRGV
jgi:hypothetical protein